MAKAPNTQTGILALEGDIDMHRSPEVKQTLENIQLVLKEAGMTFDNSVAVVVHLTDMELFQRMNAVYVTYMKEPRPVRTTVGVTKLAGKARVEITVTAAK